MELVGAGYGSPAVVGDRLYLVGRDEDTPTGREFCVCLAVADGKQIWKTPLGSGPGNFGGNDRGHGPHCTPTVEGDQVFVLGVTGDLVCLAKTNGKLVWHKNLVSDFGGKVPQWGYSESVLVDGNRVVCTPGQGTGMVALDRKTGETVWSCKEFADVAGHSSIVPTVVGGIRQYVQQTKEKAVGVRASDGKLLWRVGELNRVIAVIPTPVVTDDGYVFLTAGYGAGCECFKLTPDGEGTKAEKVYSKFRTVQNHHGGVIAVGDHVFGHSDSPGWVCFAFKKAEDEPVWQAQGVGKGAISYADGHFYCYSESDGTLALIKASPSKWDEVGRFKIPETSKTRAQAKTKVWPHPVIANGKLFLRDYEHLYCYDVKGSAN
jgi:outer membrane protein assembly factor BamB